MGSWTRARFDRAVMWGSGIAVVALLALSGYALLGGEEDSSDDRAGTAAGLPASPTSSPSEGYAPPDEWMEPGRWAVLPEARRTDSRGNAVGFPHTTEGAVALFVAANATVLEGDHGAVDEQLGNLTSFMSDADQTPSNTRKTRAIGEQVDEQMRSEMRLPADGPIPAGAYVRIHTVGFKVLKASEDEVRGWILSRTTTRAGEMAREEGGYTRTVVGAVWEHGDWKLSTAATLRALDDGKNRPAMAAPGDEAFNAAGWTAIREAS